MQVVLIGPTYPFRGGISHYTTLLYQHLGKRHKGLLISFKRQYPAFLFPGRTDRDPSQQPLRAPAEYLLDPLNPVTWLRTARRIQQVTPDVVIIKWWVPFWGIPFAVIARLVHRWTKARIVYVCHNVAPHESTLFDRALTRLALSQGDVFIVLSQTSQQLLRDMLPDAQVHLTPLPIHDGFANTRVPKQDARRQIGLAIDQPVLLFFGFVRPYKGLAYLLDALARLNMKTRPHLLIVGEFWEDKERYLAQITEHGLGEHVTIIDRYVPDEEVGLYFSACDVVVLPYASTSQSAVMSLAYGFGRPVITTSTAAPPKDSHGPTSSLIVPPRDSQALAEAIGKFFNSSLHAEQVQALEAARRYFSWERLVDLIEKVGLDNRD